VEIRNKVMNVYMGSDNHFYHKNIIRFQPDSRTFDSVEDMNEVIIERHNEVVGKNDHYYHLGDFAFTNNRKIDELLSRMNGRKHFILGNHDKQFRKIDVKKHRDIEWIRQYSELNLKQYGIDLPPLVMFHYPIDSFNRKYHGAYHVHGHEHCNGRIVSGRMDIGIDGHNLYPWSLEDVIENIESIGRDNES